MAIDSADNAASLLDAAFVLPRRRLADPDEDAITFAADAALPLLEMAGAARPDALILATTEPPYDEGGSVQPLAELLDLAGPGIALELTASLRDGLTAIRVAAGLLATGCSSVLVCASGRAGAVALLLGREGGVARLVPLAARAEELRDRWRLSGAAERAEGDSSFVWDAGVRAAEGLVDGPVAIVTPSAQASSRAERRRGGPGDPLLPLQLGAAHGPARLLLGLDAPQTVIAAAGGLAEALRVEPADGAGELRARAVAELELERSTEAPPAIDWQGISPYISAQRSWRERGQDFRLEGARCGSCNRLVFPFPARCPHCGSGDLSVERLARAGTVVTQTRDHAYPVSRATGMAVVDLDGGARFFGQVVPSGSVEMGQRVRLVPRRLHLGGGAVQYFWKVTDADRR
jgi:uncharacterized OB-fold protein